MSIRRSVASSSLRGKLGSFSVISAINSSSSSGHPSASSILSASCIRANLSSSIEYLPFIKYYHVEANRLTEPQLNQSWLEVSSVSSFESIQAPKECDCDSLVAQTGGGRYLCYK